MGLDLVVYQRCSKDAVRMMPDTDTDSASSASSPMAMLVLLVVTCWLSDEEADGSGLTGDKDAVAMLTL